MSDVSVSLGVTGKDAVTGAFSEVGKAGEALGSVFTGMVGSLAALAAGYVSVQGVIEIFKGGLNFAKEFSELSERTGIASENLVVLQRAFQNNGVAAEDLGTIINKMQKSLEAANDPMSKQAEKIRELGLSVSGLLMLSPDEQFAAIAEAIGMIKDPTDKTAISMELFGKSGGKTLALLNNYAEEMDNASKETTTLQEILKTSGGAFDKVGDNLTVLGGKLREFGVGLLSQFIESLSTLTDKMSKFDAAAFGQQIMENISKPLRAVLESLAGGDWKDAFELIYETGKLKFMELTNEILRVFQAAVAGITTMFKETFEEGSAVYEVITSSFKVIGLFLSSMILEGVAEAVKVIPGIGKQMAEDLTASANEKLNLMALEMNKVKGAAEEVGAQIEGVAIDTASVVTETYKYSDAIIDVTTQQETVNKLSDDALTKQKEVRAEAELHSVTMGKIADAADRWVTALTGGAKTWKEFTSDGFNPLATASGLDMSKANGGEPRMYPGYVPVKGGGGGGGSSSADSSLMSDSGLGPTSNLFKNLKQLSLDAQEALSVINSQVTQDYGSDRINSDIALYKKNKQFGAAADASRRLSDNQYWRGMSRAQDYAYQSGDTQLQQNLLDELGGADQSGSGYWDSWRKAWTTANDYGNQDQINQLNGMMDQGGAGPLDTGGRGGGSSSGGGSGSRGGGASAPATEATLKEIMGYLTQQFGAKGGKPYFEERLPVMVLA